VIAETDVVRLAPGVAVEEGLLADSIRGAAWPLNSSGAFVLGRVGTPLGEIAHQLAQAFSLPPEAARGDVLRFAWYLNGLALVNVERTSSPTKRLLDWAVLALRLAPAGALPGLAAHRRALDTGTVARALASGLAASLPRALLVACISILVAAQLAAIVGAFAIGTPVLLGLAAGLGLGLHEAAHAAALRGVPSAFVTRGRRTFVLHASVGPARRFVVAVAGPLAVALVGCVLVLGGTGLAEPALTFAGCPLAAHALSLTVAGGDGRTACGL
jgi:hypothetical protein